MKTMQNVLATLVSSEEKDIVGGFKGMAAQHYHDILTGSADIDRVQDVHGEVSVSQRGNSR